MRQSTLFATTLRDAPADAEAASHTLLLRAGCIRQLAAGIYTYLPLGLRVLRNIAQIVREEMDAAGAQEVLMPALQPAELWKESGRYDVYGPELMRLRDRHGREFALGPTHEEVITSLVRHEISSYRKLPVTLYQIQTKFRDERRPRFGLLRGREFMMKDAYSFDAGPEGLDRSYKRMYDAYMRIFRRCGLDFRAVEADAGAIGGEGGTHEFMALADIGEDTIAVCDSCGYAANLEQARSGERKTADAGSSTGEAGKQGASLPEDADAGSAAGEYGTDGSGSKGPAASGSAASEPGTNGSGSKGRAVGAASARKVHTPSVRTVEQVTRFFAIESGEIVKTLIYMADGRPVAVLVRGDHEANEVKVKNALRAKQLELADADMTAAVTGAPVGFAGPVGLAIPVYADTAVARMASAVTGANEADHHLIGVVPGRDFRPERTGDFRNAREGDPCPVCAEGKLALFKGIELGHVFKLGTKYSEALGARYLDAGGKERDVVMGCYGIGISRVLSAIAEQHRDDKGLVWPLPVAPFRVHIVQVSAADEAQRKLAGELYDELRRRGIETLIDDRDERAGVKFNDADLIGIPIRIVVGKHAADGRVEYAERSGGEKRIMTVGEAVAAAAARHATG